MASQVNKLEKTVTSRNWINTLALLIMNQFA